MPQKQKSTAKAPAASPVLQGPVTANGGGRLPDGQQVAWSAGWGVYAFDANTFTLERLQGIVNICIWDMGGVVALAEYAGSIGHS